MRRILSGAAVLAAVAVVAGCGGGGGNASKYSGDKKDVAKTIDDLQSAAKDRDYAKICNDIFTVRLVRRIARTTHGTACQARVGRQLTKDEKIDVQSIQVSGSSAVAIVKEQNGNNTRLGLLKLGGKWRVDAITSAT